MSALVRFFIESKHNPRKSKEEGRPIFDDIEMVEVRLLHDQRCIHVAPASETSFVNGAHMTYAERFPDEYKAFLAGKDQRVSGTPLERMGTLTPATISELNSLGIYNAETLADIPAAVSRKIGFNGPPLKQAAMEFLEVSKGLADRREKDAMQSQIDELKKMVAEMSAAPKTEPKAEEPAEGDDPFDAMSDDDLKNAIKMLTGSKPAGNPKRSTLLKQAREAASAAEENADA